MGDALKSYEEIYQKVIEIKRNHFAGKEIWFRGQGVESYFLKPSLLRSGKGIKIEEELYREYCKLASGIGLKKDTEWENLVDMQHYGIPTRLLDWTDNLNVALYFAESGAIADKNMSLYIMDPEALNRLSGKKGIPSLQDGNVELSYMRNYVHMMPFPAQYPIAVKCNYTNGRIKAQSGMFTVHGQEEFGKDILSTVLEINKSIYKINIAPEARESLKEYLGIVGINQCTIFPDIQGVARHLRDMII